MQSYNVDFKCTYRASEENDAYRDDFLDILGLERYDDQEVSLRISAITRDVEECEGMKAVIADSAARVLSEDSEVGVMMLFAYDTLDMFHDCLCGLYKGGKIEESNMNALKQAVSAK